jgi:hypothetical protein
MFSVSWDLQISINDLGPLRCKTSISRTVKNNKYPMRNEGGYFRKSEMNFPEARTEHAWEVEESSIALVLYTPSKNIKPKPLPKSSHHHSFTRIAEIRIPMKRIYFPPNQDEIPDLAFAAPSSILRSAASIFFSASFLASLPYCSTFAASMWALST